MPLSETKGARVQRAGYARGGEVQRRSPHLRDSRHPSGFLRSQE